MKSKELGLRDLMEDKTKLRTTAYFGGQGPFGIELDGELKNTMQQNQVERGL